MRNRHVVQRDAFLHQGTDLRFGSKTPVEKAARERAFIFPVDLWPAEAYPPPFPVSREVAQPCLWLQ